MKYLKPLILIVGFAIIFGTFLDLSTGVRLLRILPKEFYSYPSKMSSFDRNTIKLTLQLIPWIISIFFILKSKITSRLTMNFGFYLFTIAVSMHILTRIILYASTFIQGGGPTYVLLSFLAYFTYPTKIILVIGLLKLLLSLQAVPREIDR